MDTRAKTFGVFELRGSTEVRGPVFRTDLTAPERWRSAGRGMVPSTTGCGSASSGGSEVL